MLTWRLAAGQFGIVPTARRLSGAGQTSARARQYTADAIDSRKKFYRQEKQANG
jgi:hypothetical protein